MSQPIALHTDGTDCYTKGCSLGHQNPSAPEKSDLRKSIEQRAGGAATKPKVSEAEQAKRDEAKAERLASYTTELGEQIDALGSDENWQHYLKSVTSFPNYSFGNQLMIVAQNEGATKVASFGAWKKLGRNVKRGEKGIYILAPIKSTYDVVDEAGKPVMGEDGKPKKASKNRGFTTVPVFDISQTEGKELITTSDHSFFETPPDGFKTDLENAIRAEGFTVSYEELNDGKQGYTRGGDHKMVVIAQGLSDGEEVEVLAHELGHIKANHLDRNDEYHTGHNGKRGVMELEAESIAYVLCRSNGMSTEVGKSASKYVAGWVQKDRGAYMASTAVISQTVKALLESHSWKNHAEA